MITVQTEELYKVFGKFSALSGLNLSVEEGAIFGFLGPNGAGKTTTIRILTHLAHATSGKAWVLGSSIDSTTDEIARQIGFLPEEPAFYTWMTPLEFLDYVGRLFGLASAERSARSKELLKLAGLEDSAKRRIGGFSRGMRQRLALAQALMNRPKVLFLDEPASALDPLGRKEVLEFIEQLRGQCTVFMSTHILADVERVCDTVGIINRGKLVTQAPREALLAQYAIPALEVELDDRSKNDASLWIESLRGMPWVRVVSYEAPTLRVIVNDIETANQELMKSAVQAGIVFNRYEVVRPSLEDVFMQLVGEEESRQ
jgi:ABC-2 type transport system ATP-binding protein